MTSVESASTRLNPENQDVLIPPLRCEWEAVKRHFKARYFYSPLRKFFSGEGLSPTDADGAVNTFTLVNALLLTIKFSLIALVGPTYWDWYESTFENCPGSADYSSDPNMIPQNLFNNVYNTLLGGIYCLVITIIVAAMYYILRPTESKVFKLWWPRARWIVMLIFIGTLISMVMVYSIAGSLVGGNAYFTSSKRLCDIISNKNAIQNQRGFNSLWTGIILLFSIWGIAFIMML